VVNLFDTPQKAEGYAKARPPLHGRIVERFAVRASTVLDVGCGAGLSTAPLLRLSPHVFGIDPFSSMVKWGPSIAPGAHFLAGRAESLPFRSASFDLITAAGSLNYADPARAFPELRRVLAPNGTLVIYDFSQADFPYERPADGALPLSPEILSQMETGFHFASAEILDLSVTMTHDQYVAYLRTEVNAPDPPPRSEWRLRFKGYVVFLRGSSALSAPPR
jgi:ubiquinone/menaquinone biosynthesis C-methylase UbiE